MKNHKTNFKSLFSLAVLALFLVFQSCSKDEVIEPDTPPGGGTNDTSNITQVDVNGLAQNYINAEGAALIQIYRTLVEGYGSGNDSFTKMTFQGDGNTNIELIVKGSELQEGNFSLKKFRLGSNPTASEAVISLAVNGTLLDFEISENDRFSIAINSEGFYVLKMGPTVGIKRNSWDPELTAPISFHIVSNPAKIKISDSVDGSSSSKLYSFDRGHHLKSNQPFANVSLSQNEPGMPVSLRFLDYDFSTGTLAKSSIGLSQNKISNSDEFNGTVPKSIHIFYGKQWSGGLYTQDYSLTQNIDVELQENYILVNYTDIKLVHVTDPSKTVTVSGEISIAR